jgi:hypothetical protein
MFNISTFVKSCLSTRITDVSEVLPMQEGNVYRKNFGREIHLVTNSDNPAQNKSGMVCCKSECLYFPNAFFAYFHISFIGYDVHLLQIQMYCRLYKAAHTTDTVLCSYEFRSSCSQKLTTGP